jgi:hypothetical protein
VPGRRGPLRAPSRWRSALCTPTQGLIAQTRALPLRSVRRGDIQRCTIRRMGGHACGPPRKQSGRMPTGPTSAQSRRPACLGAAICGPSQTSTLAASPYVRWTSLGNIQGLPRPPGPSGLSSAPALSLSTVHAGMCSREQQRTSNPGRGSVVTLGCSTRRSLQPDCRTAYGALVRCRPDSCGNSERLFPVLLTVTLWRRPTIVDLCPSG